jgi:hypothetical protein
MVTPSSLRLIAASLMVAAGTVGAASAASWTGTKYPTTSGSAAVASFVTTQQSPIAVAVTPAGVPAVLYRAANKSIWNITKGSATAAWPSASTQWLSASNANAGPMIGAAFIGSKLSAMWPVYGGAKLAAATGTRTAQSGAISKRAINPAVTTVFPGGSLVPAFTMGPVSGGAAWYGASSSLNDGTGRAFGGLAAPGKVPTTRLPFEANSPGGPPQIAVGSDSTGNLTAIVRSALGAVGYATRPASTSSWTPITPLPVQPITPTGIASYIWPTSPFALGVDPVGDAVIAYVAPVDANGTLSATGTSRAVVAMQRVGTNGTFSAPQVIQVLPSQPAVPGVAGDPAVPPGITASVGGSGSAATVVVAWVGGTSYTGNTINLTRATLGQPLPAPVSAPVSAVFLTDSFWTLSALSSAVNPQGAAAVLVGGAQTQGNSSPLLATTSSVGSGWSPTVAFPQARGGCGGGYPGATVMPYNTGFVAAWMCAQVGTSGATQPNAIGVSTFR